jgi:RNA recognition motif-containing protein
MSDDQSVNTKKIFVGNLAFTATEKDLSDFFGQFGEIVEVILLTDRYSGRSRGMAFVEFTTDEAAKEAIEKGNGGTILDREIRVDYSKPPQRNDRPRNGGGGYNGGRNGGFGGHRGGGFNDNRGFGGGRRDY